MKKLFTNPEYLYINLAIGGAVGFFNCFATQLQQVKNLKPRFTQLNIFSLSKKL